MKYDPDSGRGELLWLESHWQIEECKQTNLKHLHILLRISLRLGYSFRFLVIEYYCESVVSEYLEWSLSVGIRNGRVR